MIHNYDGYFPYVSFITGDGDEIVLCSEEISRYWVTYGKKGFDAPSLRTEKRQYADGSTDILAVFMKERQLTLKMVAIGKTAMERDRIVFDIASRITQIGSRRNWGHLKVRRNDGKYLLIDCVYTGGMENINRVFPRIQEFELNFLSGNGYFYDENETLLSTQKMGDIVYLDDDLYLSNDLFLTDGVSSMIIENTGEEFYPVIDMYGPASVIRITNNTTGKTLSVSADFSLLEGQKLTFDCRDHERSITLTDTDQTQTDMTEELELGSTLMWEIVKGQNSITINYTDSAPSTFATIHYKQRYLSA